MFRIQRGQTDTLIGTIRLRKNSLSVSQLVYTGIRIHRHVHRPVDNTVVGANSWHNTVPQTEPRIVRAYRCIPPTEKFLVDLFSEHVDSFSPYVARLTVDGHFFLNHPTWWETRKNAFVSVYNLQLVEIEFEGIPLDVYLANREWMRQVKSAWNRNVITRGDNTCFQRDFVNVVGT